MNRSENTFLLLREMIIVSDLARRSLRRVLPENLGEAQFEVLSHLVFTGNRDETPSDLARLFEVSRPAMTQTLGRMRAAGLVELAPAPADGRVRHVRLTAAGRTRHAAVLTSLAQDATRLGARLGAAELEALLGQVRRFRLEAETVLSLDPEETRS
ncbi:MAG: MarR family transcriptional regulator [Pseudomonadales bacterium]|jgi:DNA-binding MarR family transcriptional regulator|nr:MarR family transcriptional regulator [Pseudomonadales bacterium]